MDIVFIDGLRVEAVIGVHEWEQRITQPGQAVGRPSVIGIQKGDTVAASRAQREIARGIGAFVILLQQSDPRRMRRTKGLDDPQAVVRRAVVDDDELCVGVGLIQHATHRILDRRRRVVARHDHGDQHIDLQGRRRAVRVGRRHGTSPAAGVTTQTRHWRAGRGALGSTA